MKKELKCEDCGRINHRVRRYDAFDAILCESCFKTYRDNPVKYIPPKGEIHKDNEGKLICHICGRSYNKLSTHIIYKHKISIDEYKETFGLNRTAKLTSKQLQEKFKNNPTVDISTVRIPFKKGHTVTKGKEKRLQAIKNRTGLKYKKDESV